MNSRRFLLDAGPKLSKGRIPDQIGICKGAQPSVALICDVRFGSKAAPTAPKSDPGRTKTANSRTSWFATRRPNRNGPNFGGATEAVVSGAARHDPKLGLLPLVPEIFARCAVFFHAHAVCARACERPTLRLAVLAQSAYPKNLLARNWLRHHCIADSTPWGRSDARTCRCTASNADAEVRSVRRPDETHRQRTALCERCRNPSIPLRRVLSCHDRVDPVVTASPNFPLLFTGLEAVQNGRLVQPGLKAKGK